jgi:hypothetical protein
MTTAYFAIQGWMALIFVAVPLAYCTWRSYKQVRAFNVRVWPAEWSRWEQMFLCKKCGQIVAPAD